jgi:hypothetical protein
MHVKPVRYQNQRCLHFITFSGYRRMKLLDDANARDIFERELERVPFGYHSGTDGTFPDSGGGLVQPFSLPKLGLPHPCRAFCDRVGRFCALQSR